MPSPGPPAAALVDDSTRQTGRGGAHWRAWRDRLLASPRFRRWAASFPLTRPIAHRRAAALFDLVAGFVYSQVLHACVQLGLFELLAAGPLPLSALAPRLGLGEDAARRLLDAAVALQLVEPRGAQVFGLGPLGAPLVGDTAIAAMVRHHSALYADLADPVALLKGEPGATALARYWPYAGSAAPRELTPQQVADYSALMAASQPLVADEIVDAYALDGHRCLLDVGGGEGVFLQRVATRAPHLRLMLFDLPAVAARARVRLAAAASTSTVRVYGGDFLGELLPRGADIATLVRVVHDHDDARALQLLRAVHAALPADGTVLLAEPMADTRGAQAMGDAYFGFYLLAMGRGRPRSRAELAALLQQAGFHRVCVRRTRFPLQTGVLTARVPP